MPYRALMVSVMSLASLSLANPAATRDEHTYALTYSHALVRGLARSFEDSLKMSPPANPIDMTLAAQQHQTYIETLKALLPEVHELPGDPKHPDSNFIEDTAIVAGDQAVISFMGAPSRRGEEGPVRDALREIGVKNITAITGPGTMDGGDVMFTGRHIFVGVSKRTNVDAIRQLQLIFANRFPVIALTVKDGLHLKSVISLFDSKTLIVADNFAGQSLQAEIAALDVGYDFVAVPDAEASNVLRIGGTLIVQDRFPASEKILRELCCKKGVNLVTLDMSELIKADGALTCGSVLF